MALRNNYARKSIYVNSIFIHQGVKGEGNEHVLRELIKKFIPKRYGVGTGEVIDRNGKQSRQCDIVTYDKYISIFVSVIFSTFVSSRSGLCSD